MSFLIKIIINEALYYKRPEPIHSDPKVKPTKNKK
jgi:hypothetical protein